ncbi:hypothetical protein [Streptomyces roseolilacinus]|uniref:hypothetical protein n=1 Tax=Streptomyces roseolilacinus TaxID=66904 RepID=UPI001678F6E5|nr:hypothetical protein [Streptomyces roseolilacinus]
METAQSLMEHGPEIVAVARLLWGLWRVCRSRRMGSAARRTATALRRRLTPRGRRGHRA